MREFEKPKIVVSKCLGFAACRWNGETARDDFVDLLKPFVEFLPVCAEVEIGLGVPREPVRVVQKAKTVRLMQPATARDFTEEMQTFTEGYLSSLEGVDGFLLKSRSPSCGIKDVKLYPGIEKTGVIGKTSGFFGGDVAKRFPSLPIEDEARLGDWRIREHFLSRIFMQADFRRVRESGSMRELVRFHSEKKFMLMAASQRALSELGRIVANHEKLSPRDAIEAYGEKLSPAFAKIPRTGRIINVLMHGLGYVSKEIKASERKYFLDSLERYRNGRIPMSVPVNILHELAIRFETDYLLDQSFFEPYPEELMLVTDSGKGRLPR